MLNQHILIMMTLIVTVLKLYASVVNVHHVAAFDEQDCAQFIVNLRASIDR